MTQKVIYVAGLPRAGSTLLCQLLGHHPDIYSIHHSSPLCHVFERMRHSLSDDPFLLSQLDVDFELTYNRILHACRGFIAGWFQPVEVYGSIETQHRKILLLNFVDHMSANSAFVSERIQQEIHHKFTWFYQQFYPEKTR